MYMTVVRTRIATLIRTEEIVVQAEEEYIDMRRELLINHR